jgi:hypothetical protein
MVTLIDNLYLDREGKRWYKTLIEMHPLGPEVTEWIELEDVADRIEEHIPYENIRILVATGGVEAYRPRKKEHDVFVFNSPNFGKSNRPKTTFGFDAYERIIDNPQAYHGKELQRLKDYLKNTDGRPISIIEGDAGNSGLTVARLCAIYKTVRDQHPTKVMIGVAPGHCTFDVKRRSSLFTPSGGGFFRDDIRRLMSLGDMPYDVFFPCEDPYIRRASEIMGVSERSQVEDDVMIVHDYYRKLGLSETQIKECTYWFRKLTLRKIERVEEVSKKIRGLERAQKSEV